jgi:hypothetical protein
LAGGSTSFVVWDFNIIALGPHSIQKVMDKRDFDGKIHTHSTNSTKFKLTRLITNNQKNNNKK